MAHPDRAVQQIVHTAEAAVPYENFRDRLGLLRVHMENLEQAAKDHTAADVERRGETRYVPAALLERVAQEERQILERDEKLVTDLLHRIITEIPDQRTWREAVGAYVDGSRQLQENLVTTFQAALIADMKEVGEAAEELVKLPNFQHSAKLVRAQANSLHDLTHEQVSAETTRVNFFQSEHVKSANFCIVLQDLCFPHDKASACIN